jgi:hypothetical protein
MSETKTRRRRTVVEKLRVVLSDLDGTVEISELCRSGDQPDAVLWLEEVAQFRGAGVCRRPGVKAVGARAASGDRSAWGVGRRT